MREIVLDTETTGMDPFEGDRIVEIGCVELENHLPTGNHYHVYINPERDVPAEVVAVHGLTDHNAAFDMKFINHHLTEMGSPAIPATRIIDSLTMARQKFPGSPASLDALCKRFHVDNSSRTLHGALLDSEILAEVYLELLGGRQTGLTLGDNNIEFICTCSIPVNGLTSIVTDWQSPAFKTSGYIVIKSATHVNNIKQNKLDKTVPFIIKTPFVIPNINRIPSVI